MGTLLFLISGVVLTLEILQTRIFAYSLDNTLVFVAVSVALLGFGMSGTLLALRRRSPGNPRAIVRCCLAGLGASIVLSEAVFARFSTSVGFDLQPATVGVLLLLALPYLLAGAAVASILSDPQGRVGRLYAANLAGSAAGCFPVFWLLGPLGGPGLVALLAGVTFLLAALLVSSARWRITLAVGGLALTVLLILGADRLFPFQEQPFPGQLAVIREAAARAEGDVRFWREFDAWDPTARVEVHAYALPPEAVSALPPGWTLIDAKWFTQDSSYGSPLIGVGRGDGGEGASLAAAGEGQIPSDPFFFRTIYGAAYFRGGPPGDVLVIGLGGAPDVQCALRHGARSITGVDINRTTVGMVRDAFREYLGDPYGDSRVHVAIRDGRSFVRAGGGRYDILQMTGVDTKSILAAGALAVNENYLYTLEGLGEYVDRLRDDGILAIVYAGDPYLRRLAVTAMEALRERGVADPLHHLALLRQGPIVVLLLKRTAFDEEETEQLRGWVSGCNIASPLEEGDPPGTGVFLPSYEVLGIGLNAPVEVVWLPDGSICRDPILRAARDGSLEAALDANPLDLHPATDDQPFFFHLTRTRQAITNPPAYLLRLYRTIGILGLLGVAGILIPILVFRARQLATRGSARWLGYFACLGGGFILAEIGLIERFVLFLGHQSYAFTVVIAGLLLAAGAGSLLSGRLNASPGRIVGSAVATIVVVILLQLWFLDPLFLAGAALPLPARLILAFATLVPLGIPLGVLFPTGLVLVRRQGGSFVPWAIGVNGVFSVLGSTVALPLAMLFGFTVTSLVAAALYVAAFLMLPASLPARRG